MIARRSKVLILVVALVACTPGQRAIARTVLDASQVTCLLLTSVTSEDQVARACGIADDLRPALREALAGKAAAARAGGCRQ